MSIVTIGSRLRDARLKKGFKSRTQLAKKLGVSHVAVGAWERDEYKPDGENLQDLLYILGVTKDWLYYGKEGSAQSASHINSIEQLRADIADAVLAAPQDVQDVIQALIMRYQNNESDGAETAKAIKKLMRI